MISKSVITMLPQVRSYLANQPVDKAWLFGSCSRGDDHKDSDVDILVRYTEGDVITLFTISRMMCALSKILGRPVDLIEDGRVLPFAEKSIDQDKVLIYEREA